jgi:hypothetical protein
MGRSGVLLLCGLAVIGAFLTLIATAAFPASRSGCQPAPDEAARRASPWPSVPQVLGATADEAAACLQTAGWHPSHDTERGGYAFITPSGGKTVNPAPTLVACGGSPDRYYYLTIELAKTAADCGDQLPPKRVLRFAVPSAGAAEFGIIELPRSNSTVFDAAGIVYDAVVVHPGTCKHPAARRGYHVQSEGPQFDALVRGTWALVLKTRAGLVCATHVGQHLLLTSGKGMRDGSLGRQATAGHVVVRFRRGTARFDSLAGGSRTRITISLLTGQSTDVAAQVRAGTCGRVAARLEIPFTVPGTNENARTADTVAVGIPFAELVRAPHVVETLDSSPTSPTTCARIDR